MPRPGDRRPLIADRAIAVVAEGGARALTHHAVDRAARLAAGSTSYYFRTRAALVAGVVARVREHSRSAFEAAAPLREATIESAASFMHEQLSLLVTTRREQAVTVFALLPELTDLPELRDDLRRCLFSPERAADLLARLGSATPDDDARDLIDYLNGLVMALLFEGRAASAPDRRSTQASIERMLRGCVGGGGS